MTTALDGHIEVDERGVARVAGSRLKVSHLVMDKMAHGSTPEALQQQFPFLTLAQVHAALTYYYDHKAEVDAEIQTSVRESEAARAAADGQPSRDQLSARLRGGPTGNGTP